MYEWHFNGCRLLLEHHCFGYIKTPWTQKNNPKVYWVWPRRSYVMQCPRNCWVFHTKKTKLPFVVRFSFHLQIGFTFRFLTKTKWKSYEKNGIIRLVPGAKKNIFKQAHAIHCCKSYVVLFHKTTVSLHYAQLLFHISILSPFDKQCIILLLHLFNVRGTIRAMEKLTFTLNISGKNFCKPLTLIVMIIIKFSAWLCIWMMLTNYFNLSSFWSSILKKRRAWVRSL